MEDSIQKPPCYGHYLDSIPTVDILIERGCLEEDTKPKCKYWTLGKDGCPVISVKKKKDMPEYKTS